MISSSASLPYAHPFLLRNFRISASGIVAESPYKNCTRPSAINSAKFSSALEVSKSIIRARIPGKRCNRIFVVAPVRVPTSRKCMTGGVLVSEIVPDQSTSTFISPVDHDASLRETLSSTNAPRIVARSGFR